MAHVQLRIDNEEATGKSMIPDSELLSRATEGNLDCLGELLAHVLPELRGSLTGQISQKWRAKLDEDDVVQVTCLEAFLSIRQFKPAGMNSFIAWLKRIATHNLKDAIESLSADKRPDPTKQVQSPGEDSHVALYEYLGGHTKSPSHQARREEAKSALARSISKLPDDYQTVIRLRELEEKPLAEVARLMNRSEGAVHMLRARALDRLRELLGTGSHWLSRS